MRIRTADEERWFGVSVGVAAVGRAGLKGWRLGRCFECSDARCQLATGQGGQGEKIRPCVIPACRRQMVLKKNKNRCRHPRASRGEGWEEAEDCRAWSGRGAGR